MEIPANIYNHTQGNIVRMGKHARAAIRETPCSKTRELNMSLNRGYLESELVKDFSEKLNKACLDGYTAKLQAVLGVP